jgi:hypothetical protein
VERPDQLPVVGTPLPGFMCPSRRDLIVYPMVRNQFLAFNLRSCLAPSCTLARTDYAANTGNQLQPLAVGASCGSETPEPQQPQSLTAGDSPTFNWTYAEGSLCQRTGVSYEHSEVRIAQIEDGTSNTAMVGEKYVNPTDYATGEDLADDQNIFVGMDRDVNRYFGDRIASTNTKITVNFTPKQDRPGDTGNSGNYGIFGSVHVAGFQLAFCDNSIRTISYDIDPLVYWAFGGRNDGEVSGQ